MLADIQIVRLYGRRFAVAYVFSFGVAVTAIGSVMTAIAARNLLAG